MASYLSILIIYANSIKCLCFSILKHGSFSISIEKEQFSPHNSIFTTAIFFDFLKYIAIPLFLLIILILVILLILNRYGFEKKIKVKVEINIKTDDFLTEIIFSDYDSHSIKKKINHYIKEVPFNKKWCRDIILNKIIIFKQNINGVDSNRILHIYKCFGFHNYSKKLILSRNWRKKLLGIYHYQVLEYKIKTGYIRPYINIKPYINPIKNKYLNSNALIAVIILSDEKFEILNDYQKKISNADEIKILDIIYHKKSALPANINDWLYNTNNSIVKLAIKLMVRYREPLKDFQISYLLSATDSEIHKETLLAIRHLYIVEANEILINYYTKENNKRNKISTLKTLGVIGNDETKDFALSILLNEHDLEIKFEIVNCINSIDPIFFKNYKVEDEVENDLIRRIVSHVTNPYLN